MMKHFYTLPAMLALSMGALAAVPFQVGKTAPRHGTLAHASFSNSAVMRAPAQQTILDEDFAAFADGSEDAPGAEIGYENGYYVPDALTKQPGWTGGGIFPAGGAVALMDRQTGGFGFISTPPLAMGGTATLTFKAKRLNGGNGSLWVALCDDYYGPGDDQADFNLTDQWETYTLVATNGSMDDPSYFQMQAEKGYVLIDDVHIDFVRDRLNPPSPNPAQNISSTEFLASWYPNGAPKYLLNVYRMEIPEDTGEGIISEDFDAINFDAATDTIIKENPGYPEGWNIRLGLNGGKEVVTEDGNYSSAPLALVIDAVSDTIVSPVAPQPIDAMYFWVKPSQYTDEESFMSLLRVETYNSATGEWAPITHIPYNWIDPDGEYFEYDSDALGNYTTQVRFSMVQQGQVAFYIDDVNIHYESKGVQNYIVKDLELTDSEYLVTDIDPMYDHYYYVQAVDDQLISQPSYHIWVDGVKGLKPVVEEATDVTPTSFTARWQPLGHATQYKVDTYRMTHAYEDMPGVTVLEEDFDAITEGTVQNPGMDWVSPLDFSSKGWASTSWCATQPAWAAGMAGTTGTSWYGTAGLVYSPCLNLSGNAGNGFDVEATVVTTIDRLEYEDGFVDTEGVFVMAMANPTDQEPIAWGYFDTPEVGATSAKVHVAAAPGVDLSSVYVAFMNKSGMPFFVDYVKITQDLKAGEDLTVPMGCVTTSGTYLTIDGLDPSSDHAYSVIASTNKEYTDYVSEISDVMVVRTSSSSVCAPEVIGAGAAVSVCGNVLSIIVPDDAAVSVCSVSGIVVAQVVGSCELTVAPGLYIVSAAGESAKVVVK